MRNVREEWRRQPVLRLVVLLFLMSCLFMGIRVVVYGFDFGAVQSIFGDMPFDWRWFTLDIVAGVTMWAAYMFAFRVK